MHSFETNYRLYNKCNSLYLFEDHIKNNCTQPTHIQTSNQNKEARYQLGGEYAYEQQSNSIPPYFDSSKHDAHIECYKQFTMSSNIARRKSEREGTSTLNKTKTVHISGKGTKQLFPKECVVSLYSKAIKIKYNKLFRRLLTLQTSADAIVCFTNIEKDGDMLKIASHGKLLKREFMVHYKCYREYTRLPKDETVRRRKFHIKNVNTKS